jgi:hypothetical protein
MTRREPTGTQRNTVRVAIPPGISEHGPIVTTPAAANATATAAIPSMTKPSFSMIVKSYFPHELAAIL